MISIKNTEELFNFLREQNIDSLGEGIKIGLDISQTPQRIEEFQNVRFLIVRQVEIEVIVAENIEGYFEIRIFADSGRTRGRQITSLAEEIMNIISEEVDNFELVNSSRDAIGALLRQIITYK